MAVPLEVAKFTSNAAVPPLRVTVKVATFVPLLPSLIVTSLIETEPVVERRGRVWIRSRVGVVVPFDVARDSRARIAGRVVGPDALFDVVVCDGNVGRVRAVYVDRGSRIAAAFAVSPYSRLFLTVMSLIGPKSFLIKMSDVSQPSTVLCSIRT